MSMEYIREYYGVPAKRGAKFLYCGWPGKVVSSRGPHIVGVLDKDPKTLLILHPTDVEWSDMDILEQE